MAVENVFFGIMVGDLFGHEDEDEYDVGASVEKYAELVTQKIKQEFGDVDVDWEQQNVGGATPHGLKTRVDGDTDHKEVETVDIIAGDVWNDWEWAVRKEG